jgi:hypothetical protein
MKLLRIIIERGNVQRSLPILLAIVFLAAGSPRAAADVGVVLNESLDSSMGRITGAGHSAVYLSRICPASPVKLRLCGPHEQGSIISNYTTLGEDQPFEWNVAPLDVYLYGVRNAEDRALFSTRAIKAKLEENYRSSYLGDLCPGPPCTTSKKAEWREMVGATAERSIYIFVVATTVEQDEALIAKFNALPNKNRFNAFTRNCATFTRQVIDMYFPHSVHPDYINDFGITSPKAIARSFARYAKRHPESGYHVLHFAQMPGTIKRSTVARDGTEQLYRSKKLLIPMIFLAGHELPIFAASYMLTGRFNPEKEYEQHSTVLATDVDNELRLAKGEDDESLVDGWKLTKEVETEETAGSARDWARYRQEFDTLVDEAVREEIIPSRDHLNRVFRTMQEKGIPSTDRRGSLWMDIPDGPKEIRVGLSPSNINAPNSDPGMAYEILLAHVDQVLKSPSHSRESMQLFEETWALLQEARKRFPATQSAAKTELAQKQLGD